eukprot:2191556-Pyramimonas_sp.AAC.1
MGEGVDGVDGAHVDGLQGGVVVGAIIPRLMITFADPLKEWLAAGEWRTQVNHTPLLGLSTRVKPLLSRSAA